MLSTCLFLKKKKLKFPRVKAQISSFESLPVDIIISVTYLAEIIYINMCFPRLSWKFLQISIGALSKFEICALTLGNEHVKKLGIKLKIWEKYIFFPNSSISYQVACQALNQKNGGFLHIHGNFKGTEWNIWANQIELEIKQILGSKWNTKQTHTEMVKSFAPKVYHLVVDLLCTPVF